MIYPQPLPDFSTLFTHTNKIRLLQQLIDLTGVGNPSIARCTHLLSLNKTPVPQHDEQRATNWLMSVFNQLFADQYVMLVRGEDEQNIFLPLPTSRHVFSLLMDSLPALYTKSVIGALLVENAERWLILAIGMHLMGAVPSNNINLNN